MWIAAVLVSVFAAALLLLLMLAAHKAGQRELAEAREAYVSALRALRLAPTDTELRQRAFAWGCIYANMAREGQFDALALVYDMAAVTSPRSTPTAELLLNELDRLKAQGLLGEADYQGHRAAILGREQAVGQ
jgi:type II secretory pathway pseudopilin PulG